MKKFCDTCEVSYIDENDESYLHCKELRHEILDMPKDSDTQAKEAKATKEKKVKQIYKIKGLIGNGFVESVLVDGNPMFLAKDMNTKKIFVMDKIKLKNEIFKPLEKGQYGYLPYSFTSAEITKLSNIIISKEEVLDEIKGQIDRFIEAKELDKHLILGDIFLTYCQEWISTIHFPFFVGETESGKSSVLHLGKWLNYRCMYGEDIPNADIYHFLGSDEEGCGTIVEDEAQEIYKNREKIRTYKSSYSKGSSKARMLMLSHRQEQNFYKTFCPKWFAGEKVPHDKGFSERLAIVYMTEGFPQSNIKRVSKEEMNILNKIRNKMLFWKIQNIENELPKVNLDLKGRDQELWEDYLSCVNRTKYYEKCHNVVMFYVNQRKESIRNSLEAKLFGLLLEKMDENLEVNFVNFWQHITTENPQLPGSFKSNSQRTFYPDDHPSAITQYSVAKIVDYKFQGKKTVKKFRESNVQRQKTVYSFKKEVLERLVQKYGITIPVDHILYVGQLHQQGQQVGDQDDLDDPLKESQTPSHSLGVGGHS